MSYMTISSQEKHNFSLCSCFHAHPTTLLLKILGGPMHERSPHLKFWGGPSPQSPLALPPCSLRLPLMLNIPINKYFQSVRKTKYSKLKESPEADPHTRGTNQQIPLDSWQMIGVQSLFTLGHQVACKHFW